METEFKLRKRSIGTVFTPARPISTGVLFAGRFAQLITVSEAILERGKHVIIYGERGVGKTSLANMIELIAKSKHQGGREVVKITCSRAATFASLWESIFHKIPFSTPVGPGAGFAAPQETRTGTMRDLLPPSSEITPETVAHFLGVVSQFVSAEVVVVIDELDRLRDAKTDTLVGIADVVKNLSDNAVPATLILVGIADSVDQLVAAHASLPRSLVQVRIPRMSPKELFQIMNKGFKELQMRIDIDAKRMIAALAQGLPHYVHLLAKHAAEAAFEADEDEVTSGHVASAVRTAIQNAAESTRNAYYQATMSAQDNRFKEVLLACALAKDDDMGYFSPSDVRNVMCEIAGDHYSNVSFARRLSEFCAEKRGPILQQIGRSRNFRYRFVDPLMEPFIVLKGLSEALIDAETIARLTSVTNLPLDVIYDQEGIEAILGTGV